MQIFWLKRNLRLQDSEPFFESMRAFRKKGKVLPLYCHEPGLTQQPDVSRQHQLFIQETLEELDRDFQSIGGKLLQAVGETVDVLDRIHRVQPLTKIWTHQETTQNSQFRRDKAVAAWCAANGVELLELAQNGIARGSQKSELFPPYFARSVSTKLRDPMGTDLSERFAPLPFPSCDPKAIPKAAGTDKPLRQMGGRSQAIKTLNRFFTVPHLKKYPFQISSPNTAWQGCSRISTYLATEFLDYEPGIHHVIHQLIAGTIEFSELMVYDPVKQGRDHDLDGHFIRKWVLELADVPGNELHDLAKTAFRLSKHAEILGYMPYPEAIVDHRATAKKAKDRVSDLRRSDSDRHRVSVEKSSEHKQDFQQSLF